MSKNLNLTDAYFVTLRAAQKESLFGAIKYDATRLSSFGEAVQECWHGLSERFPQIALDELAILPDHVHAIIVLSGKSNYTVAEVVRVFKERSARAINQLRETPGQPVWQTDDFAHAIHTERELFIAREYVVNNAHRKHTAKAVDHPFAAA